MKLSAAAAVACATTALAIPNRHGELARRAACEGPVTLDASTNVFTTHKLHANSFYREEINKALANMSDKSLTESAKKVADIGTFLWIDSIANIAKVEPAIADVPCEEILGLVIYDLPGRDCAAKASNGELAVGQLARYQSEYIDPIVKILKAHANTAFALIIEPDSLPNLVTNSKIEACQASAQGYRDGVAYAIKNLNLPNVVMYLDAGHGGWLGWNDNLEPGAKELAAAFTAGGSPKQLRGFSTNVAGWNSWDLTPGEFSSDKDATANKCQNEKIYVETIAPLLQKAGMPNHAIIDTGRNGVSGNRKAWGDWCNVVNSGFGARPSAETGSEFADAFVWVKPGGESDGTSDPSAKRFDSFCGKDDAFKPSPEAGEWNQAYFETLVKNAKPPL